MRQLFPRSFLIVAVALVYGISTLRAQTRLDWSVTQATAGLDQARCVVVDSSGTVYVAGAANGDAAQFNGSAFIAAWSANGTQLWSTTFDASLGGAEFPSGIALDGSGGLYVVGGAVNPAQTQWRGFLLRIASNGAITWSREQAVTGTPAWSPALAIHPNGSVVVGGRASTNFGDLSIASYAPSGTLAWETTFDSGFTAPDSIVDLAIAPNGDIVGVGTLSETTGPHAALMRVTALGVLVNVVQIANPPPAASNANAIAVDAAGEVFVAATLTTSPSFLPSIELVAYDPQDVELWKRTITGPAQSFGGGATPVDLALDAFGRAIVLGWRAQGSQGQAAVLAAYDVNGNQAWLRIVNDVLGGPSTNLWNLPTKLVLSNAGESIAVGRYGPPLTDTLSDAFVLGFDARGEKRFGFTYGFPATATGSNDYGIDAASAPGDAFVIAGRAQTSASTIGFDAFVAHFTRTAIGFCFGDGSGSACPCGNSSAPVERAGCAHSFGLGGRVADLGASSLAADTLALVGSSMPNSSVLYFQGMTALAGTAFGDGLRCAAGSVTRLGVKSNANGASRYPDVGDPSVSQRGLVLAPGTRAYQLWYRNAAAFCTSESFNLTNGLRVTWTP